MKTERYGSQDVPFLHLRQSEQMLRIQAAGIWFEGPSIQWWPPLEDRREVQILIRGMTHSHLLGI